LVASARAQGKGDSTMPLDEVERFALSDYLVGISATEPEGPGPTDALIDTVTKLLGLKEEIVRRHHGRVPAQVFAEHLLDGSGLALSLYDGAFAAPDPNPGRPGADPLLSAIKAPLSTAYNAYVRDELKLETDVPFLILNPETSRHWDWEGARSARSGGVMDDLAETLALTPGLHVLVVHGRTDLVTPYMASRWLLDRLDLPKEVRDRVQLSVLNGGHMMYLEDEQRQALYRLADEFYRR
jgi:carboxypeptidase C (cathepsin A)